MILSPGVKSKQETGLSQAEVSVCQGTGGLHSLTDSRQRRKSGREGLRNKVSSASSGQIRFKWPSGRSSRIHISMPWGERHNELHTYPGHSAMLALLLIGPTNYLTHPLCLGSQAILLPQLQVQYMGNRTVNAGVGLGVSVSPWTRNLGGSSFNQSVLESTFRTNARGNALLPSLSSDK